MNLADYDRRWTPGRTRARIVEILNKRRDRTRGVDILESMPSCPRNTFRCQVSVLLGKGVLLSDGAHQPVYWVNPSAKNNLVINRLWRRAVPLVSCAERREHLCGHEVMA